MQNISITENDKHDENCNFFVESNKTSNLQMKSNCDFIYMLCHLCADICELNLLYGSMTFIICLNSS